MATMIPEKPIDLKKEHPEYTVFEWFRDAPGTENWIVLHSYMISKNKKRKETEIDFVVLAPGLGIFGIEVKGGIITRRNGYWYQNGNMLNRSPFQQATEGIHSLIDYIEKEIYRFSFGYGVIFPHMDDFKTTGTEVNEWQIFNRQRHKNNVATFIKSLSKNYCENWERERQKGRYHKLPDESDVKQIAELLRPDIEASLKDLIAISEDEIIRLTKEQIEVLDGLADNPRCLIEGAAGTGKTLLAIEAARRSAKPGYKTALFCYNTLISEWLKTQLPGITVSNFHDFMFDHIKKESIPLMYDDNNFFEIKDEFDQKRKYLVPDYMYQNEKFWTVDIQEAMLKALEKQPIQFDKIIIDEGQDLVANNCLDVLDKLLKNGLKNGNWCFFADFEQTVNSGYTPEEMENIVIKMSGQVPVYTLTKNCRNTIKIGKQINLITKHELKFKFGNIECPEVQYVTWNTKEEYLAKLNKKLSGLTSNNGIKKKDIVLLFEGNDKSTLFDSDGKCKLEHFDIIPYDDKNERDIVSYTSIRRFKGLESSVVILLDINTYPKDNDKNRHTLYVGMTRARSLLIVFESGKARDERLNLQKETK